MPEPTGSPEQHFYDRDGRIVAWVPVDDSAMFLWTGRPVAWIDDGAVYSFNGRHLGWLADGWIRDHSGRCVYFTPEATGGAPRPTRHARPARSSRRARPARAPRQGRRPRAAHSSTWSNLASGSAFFDDR